MKKFNYVFWFHFKANVLSKASIITSILMFVGTLALFGVIHFFIQNTVEGEVEKSNIVIIENSERYTLDQNELNELLEDVKITFKEYSVLDDVKEAVEVGDVDNIFIIDTLAYEGGDIPSVTSIYSENSHFEAETVISQLLQQQYLEQVMEENNVSPEVAQKLLMPIEFQAEPLQNQEEAMISFAISYVFSFALYMLLIVCGQMIAMSVVTEKSSRVMEVMISKVNPVYMMFAKILAVLSNVLVLILSVGGGALVAYLVGWLNLEFVSDFILPLLSGVLDTRVVLIGVTFVLLGYFLYGMLFATAGAICSQVETLSSVTGPLLILIMLPFLLPIYLSNDSIVLIIGSYIPFFSPFIMFERYLSGSVSILEVGIALGIMILAIAIIGNLATKVYVNGVMYYSEKVSWKEVSKLLKRQ